MNCDMTELVCVTVVACLAALGELTGERERYRGRERERYRGRERERDIQRQIGRASCRERV